MTFYAVEEVLSSESLHPGHSFPEHPKELGQSPGKQARRTPVRCEEVKSHCFVGGNAPILDQRLRLPQNTEDFRHGLDLEHGSHRVPNGKKQQYVYRSGYRLIRYSVRRSVIPYVDRFLYR